MNDVSTHFFAIGIRKLAAEHQAGKPCSDTKREVDQLIQSMRDIMGPDKAYQVQKWSQLLEDLNLYNNSRVDPRWETIITHARNRIKTRKRTAMFYKNRFRKETQ
ncbi:hypothetical protein SAMN06273570_4962 [Candidatus Pantoea floridensis]|uniref:Uncharacterized protein n=1 Tax=Candidatus Pantoea floridensis TaxID=1938870 RepID=A0A286DR21_9GAMM|nr:hypothetical protein BX596_5083 [Enterobacteriaceae bacterium JKS000233]SOD61125.1 hypothetical protein SAMN06273570_4962 [Pantoea floridensis]